MLTRKQKNKISTPGYFLKRLKDNKFSAIRIFQNYSISDPRKWTILIDPGVVSVYVTCYENREFNNEVMFEFNDGNNFFPRNFSIKTNSIEVIINLLVEKGVQPIDKDSKFFSPKPNNIVEAE